MEVMRQRISASIDNWKRRLLDLTKRNRLLHFRVTPVSTVQVVDELPAEVFRRLYLAEKAMRFRPMPEDRDIAEPRGETRELGDSAGLGSVEALLELVDAESDSGVEYVPYEASRIDERHRDEWLQTTLGREALDRSLRRIDEQARLTIEEQGVNTLFLTLGMLHYTEAPESEEVFRGPLVMLPVELSRRSARSGFELRIGDDEPMVNPALAEHLRRMGVVLPDLPESDGIDEDYNLQAYFADLTRQIDNLERWSVRLDIYLGLFSFQKFVMFKDLETNAAAVGRHRLIRQLVGREGSAVVGLPDEIRELELDMEFPPERTFQVVDADSSQLRAIAACARGYDLVIEGPPGTGKSQTITNLIAQALADGKSVLFVAEKMAALDVVHTRLKAAGLGEFCLELHSSRANKRQVMQDLATTLDASLKTLATTADAGERLPTVRHVLTEYVTALHTPYGTLQFTPYRGYGELGAVRNAPAVSLEQRIDDITRQALEATVRDLEDLARAAEPIGNPAQHPWRGATRTLYTEADLDAVSTMAAGTLQAAAAFISVDCEVQEAFGLPPLRTVARVDGALKVGALLAQSPGAPLAVLQNDAWNTPPPAALGIIELGREMSAFRERTRAMFTAAVLEREHRDDIAFVRHKADGAFGFLAGMNGRYRAIRKRWKTYRLPTYRKSLLQQADDLDIVDRLRARLTELRDRESEALQLFGDLWQGERSDWDALDAYVRWVVEFRRTCTTEGVAARAYTVASQPAPDTKLFDRLRSVADEYILYLRELAVQTGWPTDYLLDEAVADAAERIRALASAVALGPQWAAFERCCQAVHQGPAAALLAPMLAGEIDPSAMSAAFKRAFFMEWLGMAVRERPPLERFASLTHEQRVAEFRELDQRVLRENQAKLIQLLRDRAQARLREPEAKAALPHLQRQISRQRNISPLRRTMNQAGAAIRVIKPCFMMSPMTVAQLLDGTAPTFDIVIFDEASQLPTEDAVGAVIRGKQLVVVGDPKQLPPTNFFSVASGQVVAALDTDGNPLYEDSESVLEEFMGAGVPMSRLKWHYRSAHETLINFSNVSFYDADLYTFPSLDTGTGIHGLQYEYLSDGCYEGKGLNAIEARFVADEVVRFAREQIQRARQGQAPLSLGVGTFNLRQQIAIQDELERRRRDDHTIEEFFARGKAEPFFVKNLENIQGDERDVIFISVTYGPGPDRRIRYNFGPLNGENGWRRLNVLVTRARQRMRVFSSLRGEDINPSAGGSNGPRLLREFLIYAQHGRLDGTVVLGSDAESLFEREVLRELANRGLRVVPQVGSSGYRIDIGVLDKEVEGRFICGIECDGAAYHSSETARDRDRLRQQVLEARGWTIHRVWSTDWFKDRKGQIERLLRLIEADQARAREEDEVRRANQAVAAAAAEGERLRREEHERREAEEIRSAVTSVPPYERPVAPPYVVAEGAGRYAGQDLLTASETMLLQAIQSVVNEESPIHQEELLGRVAGMWSTKLGSRIRRRLESACKAAVRSHLVRKRGHFFWGVTEEASPRSRAGMRMAAERIAPEEYRAAVLAVLNTGHSFQRTQLAAEVRAVLGFNRTGAQLEEAIMSAINALVQAGTLGEGSAGLKLRQQE